MKTVRSRSGPFSERPHFKDGEIERMCFTELKGAKLLPSEPEPIRIDRFIEIRFEVTPSYEQLGDGILGFTEFGPNGVRRIVVNEVLDKDTSAPARRRLRSTLAHEAGHALLHLYLFALGSKPASLFGEVNSAPEILCRDVQGEHVVRGYDGRWWEYQANRAIGGFLLPGGLFERACEPYLEKSGAFSVPTMPTEKRELASRALAEIFDVNPIVVSIRLDQLFPGTLGGQLSF